MSISAHKKVLDYKPFSKHIELLEVEYDFANDTGASGAFDLMVAGEDLVIHNAYAKVKTTCTSGGSATVSLGVGGVSATSLMAATAVASLAAGAVIDGTENIKVASAGVVQMTVAVADLTAGKIVFGLEVSRF